ncbi:MAG: response regulator [Papillibacter sp.]|jgi:two-component system chemotaxis response regulator CheY|nr:response regulator [Papillibacter sp.]
MSRIMIVDDAAFMRITIKNYLRKSTHEVVAEAENGKVAVEQYKIYLPDIVTMDITMPEMDGLSALKAIMQINPKANVVMVSAMGQESMVREAIMAGAKGFIVKPFKEEGIISAIDKLSQ